MLFITGLMGLHSLCVLSKAFDFGVMSFICIKYFFGLCVLLCYIYVLFVECVFEMFLRDLYLIAIFDFLV